VEELALVLWRERELLELLHETELMRAVVAGEVAEGLGLAVDASLAEIVDHAPEPWRTILEDHRAALLASGTSTRSLADFLA
jgi:hypothetical protein